MKKSSFLVSCLLLGALISGCSCNKKEIDTFASISNANEALSNNKGEKLTVGNVYNFIRENNNENISKNILKTIVKDEINWKDSNMLYLYEKYINQEFKTKFIDSGSYNYDGKFSEELVVKYLQSESYKISCESNSDSVLDKQYFTCDYSDYIEKELNYDVYLKMLKVKYIIDEKENLLDRSKARKVSYYSISRTSSSDYETREKLEEYVASIEENYNSTDTSLIRNIEDIAKINKKKDLDKLKEDYDKVSTSTDSNQSYKYLQQFTVCGDKRCKKEDGYAYQQDIINKKEYLVSKIVVNTDTSILYEKARNVLFSDNIDDYLYPIGNTKYLISQAYINVEEKDVNSIILFDSSSTYYIATVDVIDSDSDFLSKAEVAELLLDKISDADVLDYYFENVELEIYDKEIRDYFVSKYGEY